MALTVEYWQDSGPVTSGRGTTRISVNNVGYKSSGLDESNPWVYYPVRRPQFSLFNWSYTQYNYFKISGTYPAGKHFYIEVTHNVEAFKCKLYGKLTNVYQLPSNDWDSSLTYIPPGASIFVPRMSTSSPHLATTLPTTLSADTTYFSEYLVTQLYVEPDTDMFGNLPAITFRAVVYDYESSL